MKIGKLLEEGLSEEQRGEGLRNKHSYSKLNTASRCMRKFFFKYVVGLKEFQDFLIRGRAVHAGQEYDNREKLLGHILKPKHVLEAAVQALEEEGKKLEKELDKDSFAREHAAQLDIYEASGERSKVRPVEGSIEAPFEINLTVPQQEPAVVSGFLDTLSYGVGPNDPHVVVDYKAGKRPVKEKEADQSFQFDLYRLGSFEGPLKIVNFVAGGRQKAGAQVTQAKGGGEKQRARTLNWVQATITSIRLALKTGDFPRCAPECFWCAPTACEFYRKCYPAALFEVEKLVQVQEIKRVGTLPQPEWRKSRDHRGAHQEGTEGSARPGATDKSQRGNSRDAESGVGAGGNILLEGGAGRGTCVDEHADPDSDATGIGPSVGAGGA